MVNYFEVLNVSEHAEPEVIKASYRALCKKYHPDNQSGHSAQDDEKMQLINEAYQILSDPVKKAEYISRFHMNSAESRTEKQTTAKTSAAESEYPKPETNNNFKNQADVERRTYTSSNASSYKMNSFDLSVVWKVLGVILVIIAFIAAFIHFAPGMVSDYIDVLTDNLKHILDNF